MARYGAAVGQAFQIADDLLDIEGDAATVGKQTGKDAAAGKATIVAVLGLAKSKERLAALVGERIHVERGDGHVANPGGHA